MRRASGRATNQVARSARTSVRCFSDNDYPDFQFKDTRFYPLTENEAYASQSDKFAFKDFDDELVGYSGSPIADREFYAMKPEWSEYILREMDKEDGGPVFDPYS